MELKEVEQRAVITGVNICLCFELNLLLWFFVPVVG